MVGDFYRKFFQTAFFIAASISLEDAYLGDFYRKKKKIVTDEETPCTVVFRALACRT